MQRRLLAIPLVAALSLAVTSCSNNPSSGGESGQTLTVFTSSDLEAAYTPVFEAFEEANPGVTINPTYGTGNEFESTQVTQLASGSGPDLIDVLPGSGGNVISVGSLQSRGYLEDLSSSPWAAEIPDSLRSQTDVDGQTYSFPGLLQPLGAFYNTGALSEAGLTAPTTYSEVLQFCRDATAAGRSAYSLGIQDLWVGQLIPYALASTLVYGADPTWNQQLVDGAVTFPDSAWAEAEGKYLEMEEAGCFTADPNGVGFDNSLPPVANGDALAVVQVGGVFGTLQGLDEAVSYDLAPLPATDDPEDTFFAASPGHGFAINAASENTELARQFLDFMASPEQINSVAAVLAGVPAVPNSQYQASELLAPFEEFVANGRVTAFPDTGWPNAEIQNAHLVGIQNMFGGSATPEQVLTDMQDAVG